MRQKGIPLWPFLAPHKLSLSCKSFIQMFLVQVCRISYRPHLTKLCNCNLATLKCSLNGMSSVVSMQSVKRNDQKMFSTNSVVQIFLWRDRVGFQSQIHLNWRRQILLSRYSSCYAAIREGSQRTNWTELQFANSSQSTSWRWRAWPITRRVTGSTWCRSVQFVRCDPPFYPHSVVLRFRIRMFSLGLHVSWNYVKTAPVLSRYRSIAN